MNQEDKILEMLVQLQGNMSRMESHMDTMEVRMNDRMDAMEVRMNDRMDAMEVRINDRMDAMEVRINDRMDAMEVRLNDRMDVMEGDIRTLKKSVAKMEMDIEVLHGSVVKMEVDYGQQLGGIWDSLETIRKSQDVRILKQRVNGHEERITSLELTAIN